MKNIYSFSQVIIILIVLVASILSVNPKMIMLFPHTHIHQSVGAGKSSNFFISNAMSIRLCSKAISLTSEAMSV